MSGYPQPLHSQGTASAMAQPYDPVLPMEKGAARKPVQGGQPPLPTSVPNVKFSHEAEEEKFTDGFAAGCYASVMTTLGSCLGVFGSVPCCICFPNPYRVIQQGHVGLFTRFGRYTKTMDPGMHYMNLITEKLFVVDIKMQVTDIPRQTAVTRDNVSVNIDSVLYWHVVDPYKATFQVQSIQTAIIERTMTTLRQVIGTHELQDAITNRDTISEEIERIIAPPAASWGAKIESILLKDILFSSELQESLSAAARQKRIAASKVIAAQGEVDAAKLMREASDILNTPAAMQIRYLDTLKTMSGTPNSKIIFMPPNVNNIDLGVGAQPQSNSKLSKKALEGIAMNNLIADM